MLQDFSSDSLLEQVRELIRIDKELAKVSEELREARVITATKKSVKNGLEERKSKALVLKQNTNIFSRLASFFHRGKHYEMTQQINEVDEELRKIEAEWTQARQKEETLTLREKELMAEKESKSIPECIKETEGRVVITDKEANFGGKNVSEERVLVHCTDFFPTDNKILSNYDGNKILSVIKKYNGVRKKTKVLSHRHEVHFTINNRVENTGAGEGTWNNPSYMIIDRYDAHEDEMESMAPSDAWTKGTSLKLSDDAVIMVRIQEKDKTPVQAEDVNKYNIVYYDGEPTKCLRNFLRLNNYEILPTDANNAKHSHSSCIKQEDCCDKRDLAINFVKDNSHFSKVAPHFSAEDIVQIMDVALCSGIDIFSSFQKKLLVGDKEIAENQRNIYLAVAEFVIGSGLTLTGDGRYTFKRDEEILDIIKDLDRDPKELPSSIELDFIDECFEMHQEFIQKRANIQLPSIEEFGDMSLKELYQFKNQLKCEALQKTLPQYTLLIGGTDEFYADFLVYNQPELKSKIKQEDGIIFSDVMGDALITKILEGSMQVSQVPQVFDEFKKQVEEIKGRDVRSTKRITNIDR